MQLKVICPGMDGVLLKVTHTKLHPQSSWHVFHFQGYISEDGRVMLSSARMLSRRLEGTFL